ncbi:MAG TPA: hypothetical protein ENK31_10350 [Nannocystis exedens]|nr:hypothetical protein [Nannocystis exedens]
MAEFEPPLAATLLHQAPRGELPTVDGGSWAYGRWRLVLWSLFIGYHVLALLLYITPRGGLARQAKDRIERVLHSRAYILATSNTQTWSMFAPNPHRKNIFVRVLVEDQSGETWDLGHDMHGRRTYPYVFYDRMAKINRRLPERRSYLRPYAAWVCREWERQHGGQPAKRVHMVKIWSRIPPPKVVYRAPAKLRTSWTTLGYDPLRLHLHREPLEVFECALLREGQLSPLLRARFGLPEAPAGHYRPAEFKTWVHEAARGEQEHDARPK